MKHRVACLMAVVSLLACAELFACGDKFLVGSRGTRFHRPKNVRTASILIYADPANDASATARVKTMLDRRGDKVTRVESVEQLTAMLSRGGFDVVLATNDMAARVQRLVSGAADAAAFVALDTTSHAALLTAIDRAVVQHDALRKK